MLAEAKPGAQVGLLDGTTAQVRTSHTGEATRLASHARYQEAIARGSCYTGGMASAAAMGTALTATMVTICLYNPQGSGVNLVLLNISGQSTGATSAGAEVGDAETVLAANIVQNQAAPSGTTALIAHTNCLLGGSQGKGKLYSQTTLAAAPTFVMPLLFSFIPIGSTGIDTVRPADIDIAGRIVLPPNTSVCIQGVVVGASISNNGRWSMTWEEVSI